MRPIRYEDKLVHGVGVEKRQLTNPLNLINKCGLGVALSFGNMIEKLSVFCCNPNEMLCAVSSRPIVNWTLGVWRHDVAERTDRRCLRPFRREVLREGS